MVKKLLLAVIFIFASNALYAEGNTTQEDSAKKVESKSDNLDSAYALLKEMGLKKVYESAIDGYTQRLVQANSNFKPIESKIKEFYQKYVSWDIMKKDLAKLYSKYYTPEELKDITNFYKTKTGKKVLSTMGKIAYEGQMLTQKRLRPHLDELKKLLDDAMAKAKDSNKKDDKKEAKK